VAKKYLRHRISKQQAHWASPQFIHIREANGPTENMDAPPPAGNAHAHKIHEKNWKHFEHFRTNMARTGQFRENSFHEVGADAIRPRVER